MTTVAETGRRLESIARPKSVVQRNLNLIVELAITQFKLKYTGSALGYVWSLLKPLMLFGIMYLVFSVLLKVSAGTKPGYADFPVQLLIGIVVWTFFAESTTLAMNAIAGAGDIIRKAYFPRWILVVASTGSALLTFAINMILVIIVTLLIGGLHLSWRSLLAPVYFVELAVLVIGLSLLLSALFVFFRDLGHIWEILSLVLFYGSAVVYPFSRIPGFLQTFAGLNPVAQILLDLRHALVAPQIPSMASSIGALVVIPIVLCVVLFFVALTVFNRLTPRFAEEL